MGYGRARADWAAGVGWLRGFIARKKGPALAGLFCCGVGSKKPPLPPCGHLLPALRGEGRSCGEKGEAAGEGELLLLRGRGRRHAARWEGGEHLLHGGVDVGGLTGGIAVHGAFGAAAPDRTLGAGVEHVDVQGADGVGAHGGVVPAVTGTPVAAVAPATATPAPATPAPERV